MKKSLLLAGLFCCMLGSAQQKNLFKEKNPLWLSISI